ncbi:tail fiber assembly protein [Pseudomonas sp. NMI760_13]|uniref:tail fiber assembly protein n=1 Tax=Pseudomonas sp. NMI760_13 TaxID=2903147 RepID=UPI001E287627|nr:tail fiber assembly protein [Pseudomonas sp. NMI760_13]MCE0916885.1 tail fiber assembly protein [Pseudomonas sp. NMI760_13]
MTDQIIQGAVAAVQSYLAATTTWWQQAGVVAPLVCNVDPASGEFLGACAADPSPLEPGVWLIPAHSYRIQPPELKTGFAAIATQDGKHWDQVVDHRGATVYRTADGEAQVWIMLGELPGDFTLQAPTSDFDTWNGSAWVVNQLARGKALRQSGAHKQALLVRYATLRISSLQDAVALEMATDAEVTALTAWKRYRIELNRLDLSAAAPTADSWPASPDEAAAADWLTSQGFEEVA